MKENDKKLFFTHIKQALSDSILVKVSLSKPRHKEGKIKNVYVRPVQIKDSLKYQVSYRSDTQDFVENMEADSAISIIEAGLTVDFFNGVCLTTEGEYSLLQNKKGSAKLIAKKESRALPSLEHNRSKKRYVLGDAEYLHKLGITSSNGHIIGSQRRKYKQIDKYLELIETTIKDKPVSKIVDMGSGKGYLTFALYDYLTRSGRKVDVQGIESRKSLIEECNNIAKEVGYSGLKFVEGNIQDVTLESVDMVIALHACDIATDMAIAQGIDHSAQFIITAPCCHKQVRKSMNDGKTSLQSSFKHGILLERQAVLLTDAIRALILEAHGYTTKVIEFISVEHTSKNIMIIAERTGSAQPQKWDEVNALKEEFGIGVHYLETLCKKK